MIQEKIENIFNYQTKKAALINARKRRSTEASKAKLRAMMVKAERDLELVKPWISKIENSTKNFDINFEGVEKSRELELKLFLALLIAGRKESQSKYEIDRRENILVGLYSAVTASRQYEAVIRTLGISAKSGLNFLNTADDFRVLKTRRSADFRALINRSKSVEVDEKLKIELAPLYDGFAQAELKLCQLVELSDLYSKVNLKDPQFGRELRFAMAIGFVDLIVSLGVLIASAAASKIGLGLPTLPAAAALFLSALDAFLSGFDLYSNLKDLQEYELTGDSILDYSSEKSLGAWTSYYSNARYVWNLAKFGGKLKNRFFGSALANGVQSVEKVNKLKWGYSSAKLAWSTYNNFSFQVLDQFRDESDSSSKSIVKHLIAVAMHMEKIL